MEFERLHLNKLEERIASPRRFIQAITGPRQIGKTTLVKQLIKK
jgi:predicted AAA+ superfamily ATPase